MSYRSLLLGLSVVGCLSATACSSDSKTELPVNTGAQPGTGGDAAGSGGAAAGGTPSSGGSTASSGGSTASSGGSTASGGSTSSGGAAATGGTANTGGASTVDSGSTETDAGFTPNPGTVDVVVCKDDGTTCTSSENCCYTRAVTFPTQTPATYTCSDKPCTGGDIAVSCDGREDCKGGQSCCRVDVVGGGTSYSCRDTCNSTIIGCSGTANCPAGTVCCQHQFLQNATETECSATCSGSGSYIMCSKKSECPANAPNCVNSSTVPGMRVCAQ